MLRVAEEDGCRLAGLYGSRTLPFDARLGSRPKVIIADSRSTQYFGVLKMSSADLQVSTYGEPGGQFLRID
jgi:hypothetical protein